MIKVDNQAIRRQFEKFLGNYSAKGMAVVVAVIVAFVGAYVITESRAATPVAAVETESGVMTGGAARISDGNASGGQAVRFLGGTFQANCITKPSNCGYPDETNTGVPASVTLKTVPTQVSSGTGWSWDAGNGMIRVTGDGAVLDGLNIAGSVDVLANNVTIKNTRIISGDYYPIRYFDNNNTGLLIEDTEIAGTSSDVTSSIAFSNYTARRVNVHGGADGLKTDGNVTIEDSYIHDLSVGNGTHNDGFQTTGSNAVTLRHNTCKLSTTNGANACIQMGTESGSASTNWLVTNNLFDGGGWTINATITGGSNNVFTNNRFTRNAGYGPVSIGSVTWTGNYYDDTGAALIP
jgi:hypothetical protein